MSPDYKAQTQAWIQKVVVGLNFCPFASRVLRQDSIHYEIRDGFPKSVFLAECRRLDEQPEISTSFLILTQTLNFDDYLEVVDQAQGWLERGDYVGVYQLASFHPEYCFDGSDPDDAANYTNRSPFPMLHLLREQAVSDALDSYPDAEAIPDKNIACAQCHGLIYMQQLLRSCCTEESGS